MKPTMFWLLSLQASLGSVVTEAANAQKCPFVEDYLSE